MNIEMDDVEMDEGAGYEGSMSEHITIRTDNSSEMSQLDTRIPDILNLSQDTPFSEDYSYRILTNAQGIGKGTKEPKKRPRSKTPMKTEEETPSKPVPKKLKRQQDIRSHYMRVLD